MSRLRTLLVCPGRGSYGRDSLGSLKARSPRATQAIAACDAWRAQHGRPTVTELDRADRFRSAVHVAGEHASLLTFAAGLADALDLDDERYDVVGVTGNSMGWYTALAVAGALPLNHAIRLVDTMGQYQAGNVIGGQILYPVTDADWQPDAGALQAVDDALSSATDAGHVAEWSIQLGGYAVLGADTAGVKHLMAALPPLTRSSRSFPIQLPLHSAFHTSLMDETSARAQHELSDLPFTAPRVPLVDGRGVVHRPVWADPADLFAYTLGTQVVEAYDFTNAVRTALRHVAPDVVVALGPGNALGGPLARILVQEGWSGIRSRSALSEHTPSVLRSFGLPPQRATLVAP